VFIGAFEPTISRLRDHGTVVGLWMAEKIRQIDISSEA
jgi:hypothetical protein